MSMWNTRLKEVSKEWEEKMLDPCHLKLTISIKNSRDEVKEMSIFVTEDWARNLGTSEAHTVLSHAFEGYFEGGGNDPVGLS